MEISRFQPAGLGGGCGGGDGGSSLEASCGGANKQEHDGVSFEWRSYARIWLDIGVDAVMAMVPVR